MKNPKGIINVTQLNYTTFKPLLNQKFEVKFPEPPAELSAANFAMGPEDLNLELVEVTEIDNEHCEGFSLIFHGPENHLLPQKTYHLKHGSEGDMNMFMVPIGERTEGEGADRKVTGYVYQAIFNRLKKKQEVSS